MSPEVVEVGRLRGYSLQDQSFRVSDAEIVTLLTFTDKKMVPN